MAAAQTPGQWHVFPVPDASNSSGMVFRDWMAGQAVGGIAAGFMHDRPVSDFDPAWVGKRAVEVADAVIAALNAPKG